MKKRRSPEKKFHLTYRTRRALRRLGITLGVLAVVLGVGFVCWFSWLSRFVVYSSEGARLDFDTDFSAGDAVEALPPEYPTVQIHYNEGDNVVNTSTELTRITGCYVTTDMILESVPDIASTVESLPKGTAVLLDLKSGFGNFYYSAGVPDAPIADQVDVAAMDDLIAGLAKSDTYLIARIPAFRDRYYGLNHTVYGLAVTDQSHLWADDDQCYWLDPTSTGTLAYLIAIVTDLRDKGFDEVVFTDFRFPPTEDLFFSGNRVEALNKAAEVLVSSCATSTFAVSFESGDPGFSLPQGRSRLFLTGVSAAQAQSVYDGCTFPLRDAQLVFRTEANDTRFDVAGVVRPLPVGQLLP